MFSKNALHQLPDFWKVEAMLERTGFAVEQRACAESGVFAEYTCRRV